VDINLGSGWCRIYDEIEAKVIVFFAGKKE
jgi:hypothetical protein